MHKDEQEFARLSQRVLNWATAHGGAAEVLDEVDSTSDRLRRHLPDGGVEDWALCLARHQTAGRGRGGHAWVSAADAGLWFSLRLPVTEAALQAAAETPPSVVLAAALVDCLAGEGVDCGLKWPNDLWLDDRKVGGLLIEQFGQGGRRYWVVGIGINWRAPDEVPPSERAPSYRAGGLEQSGVAIDRPAVAEAVIARVVETMQQPQIWAAWMPLADRVNVLTGRQVELVRERELVARGRVVGIAADGELVLTDPAGGTTRVGGAASVRFLD